MSDNPFLLPPDARRAAAAPAPAAEPATTEARTTREDAAPAVTPAPDRSGYIAVPASVESATHRIERPAQAAEPEGVAEETRVAAPRRWALTLPDGAQLELAGPMLVGRDPAHVESFPDAALLPVADSGKTVSKTHALLQPSPEGVRVRDLHSTNGIAIDTAAGRALVPPGGDAVAPTGATIMLGSFAIRITG